MKNILCLWNRRSDVCIEAGRAAVLDMKSAGLRVAEKIDEFDGSIDLVVLLGGDGFLLESLHELDYPSTPIFGINFGSVGFLVNAKECLSDLTDTIREKAFVSETHTILRARVFREDGSETALLAFNEFVIERMSRQSVRMLLALDAVEFNRFAGDGFIFSTAAGSTAYNLAAGGPVLYPGLQVIIVTPLYPHRAVPFTSMQFPLVVPLKTEIEVRAAEVSKRPMRLVADGRSERDVVKVVMGDSGKRVQLLRLLDHSFVRTLKRKFVGE